MKLLIVGAGAVGQVFGLLAQRGGAEVSVYVRPKVADEARAGFQLFDHGREGAAERFVPLAVLTTPEEVAAGGFDALLLCTSSTALYAGSWLKDLVEAAPDATIVGLQPGGGDAAHVRGLAGADRVVWGVIELISYQSPLPNGAGPGEGVAFWIPRWLVFPFSGPDGRIEPIVALYAAGGVRARRMRDAARLTALGAPVMMLYIVALEVAGWRFAAVREDRELLRLTHRAVQEAVAIAAREEGAAVPLWTRLVRPWQIRLLSRFAAWYAPLEIEPYLQFHFTKVGDQTRAAIARWLELAPAHGLPMEALAQLRVRLDAAQRAVA